MKNFSIFSLIIVTASLMSFGCVQKIQENSGKVTIESENQVTTSLAIDEIIDINYKKPKIKYQDNQFTYFVRGAYNLYTTQTSLQNVNDVSDLIPNYPSGWITDYTSVDISIDENKTILSSPNNQLSSAQIDLLKSSPIGTDINILVKYKTKNAATNKIEENQMELMEVSVIPETEAEYTTGVQSLIDWFEISFADKISKEDLMEIRVSLQFIINKEGYVQDINITEPDEDAEINRIIEDVVSKMKKWNPAKNSHGEPVDQKFQLVVGSLMGC